MQLIFLSRDKKPICMQKRKELLETITGQGNSNCVSFYDWIYPEDWHIEKRCIVSTVESLREYCRGLPNGDLARP